jgi:RNA polymerase sigma-32 factor
MIQSTAIQAAGSILAIPQAQGSIEAYIRAVRAFPVLSADEELALAQKKDSDPQAAKLLVLAHLRLVVSVARGYLGYGLPHADLIQEGNIGLMKAVRGYNPARGARLMSYAVHWIRAEIQEYVIRNWRMLKVASTKAQRKLFFKLRSLKQGRAGMNSNEAERIASALKVERADVMEMDQRMYGADIAFDADDDAEAGFSPELYLSDDAADPMHILETAESANNDTSELRKAIDRLDSRSRRVIEARWLKKSGKPATLHELAAEMNVSAERVRQIQQKALLHMRHDLEGLGAH